LFAVVLLLTALAAAAGLVGPWLLGLIVDAVKTSHGPAVARTVDRLALTIIAVTAAQLVLTRYALYLGTRFGERTAARIRESFLNRTLTLPYAVTGEAATGDLVARATIDVSAVAITLCNAAPAVLVAGVQALFILGAVLVIDPLLGLCGLVCPAFLAVALRWYLRRARTAYLAEGAANSALAEMLTETASGARTVEALGLHESRRVAAEAAIAAARRARLRTLGLRTVLFPAVDISYTLPLVAVLLAGGALYDHHAATLGAVVAAALYLRQIVGPLDDILLWVEQLQSSSASYARVEGLADILSAAEPDGAEPAGDRIDVAGVYYAYGHGRNVLHDVSLLIRPGERLAIVGPSGAGKSTLGRLLAGVDKPRRGTITVGGVPLTSLSPEHLRRRVVLVTQEHHVFRDTLRDNLLLARPGAADADLASALDAVGAGWVEDLPDGLDTELGTDRYRLDGAQAEQLALARVVLANPHTLVLDEATALLDPATARNTERALAMVLQGRTVIAIAHRLQTAHDADRVAVMNAGAITEIGTHDELVATGGGYAALWQSWHGEPT
jgi:ATP-binding cassette subfamily C protein